jgi:integrase
MKTEYLRRHLTEAYIRDLKSENDLQISDEAIPGLQMRYSGITGRKVFYLNYRIPFSHKQRNMKVGRYGDYTLKEIRERAIRIRQLRQEGKDPMLELRQAAKENAEAAAKKMRVKDLIAMFLAKHCAHIRETTQRTYEAVARLNVLPAIGNKPIDEIGLTEIQDIYDEIMKKKSVGSANQTRLFISVFLNWCEKYGYRALNSNPCKLIQKGKKPKFHYETLDADGYKKLFAAFDFGIEARAYPVQSFLALKMLALTGCRCSEIKDLEYDELDLENGFLHLKKRKTDFVDVPLGQPAIDIIREALETFHSKKFVFPAARDNNKPCGDLHNAFNWALERAGLPHMRIHDLRHSFATMAIEMGESILALKDVLGHTRTTTTEIYMHNQGGNRARATADNVSKMMVG